MTTDETNPKRKGAGWRIGRFFRWGLALFGILLAPLFLLTIINSLRPVDEPPGFRPDPAMRAMIEEMTRPQTAAGPVDGKTAAGDQATTGSRVGRAVVAASVGGSSSKTPASAPAVAPASVPASAPEAAMRPFEVIPEDEMRTAEERAEARRFNEDFRRWAELMRLYEADFQAYCKLPAEQKEPFGSYYVPSRGYWTLLSQLSRSRFSPEHRKRLVDAYFQLIFHYEGWEAVTELAAKDSMLPTQYHTWDEALYCMRQIPKPLVKYPCIAVWSGVHLVNKIVHSNRQEGSRARP